MRGELPPKMREKIYHDVLLPDEAEEIRKEVKSFAEKEIEPCGWELDNAEEKIENFPEEIFNKMANEGLFAIPFSEEFGGRGLEHPVCSMVVTMEELGYASGSIAGIYDVQAMLTGHLLSQYASRSQKEEYLKPLIKGEKIGCFATTEPGASNDLRPESLETTAEKDGDTWIVNGQKRYISDAPVGDFVATLCVTDGSLNEILIDLDSDGVEVGEPDKKMGNRAQLVADIKFDNVEVPESNLIGEKGEGLRIALATLTYGRIGVGASGVGGAQAGFDETVNYLKKRTAFGRKLAQFQYQQFKLAEMATKIENARNLCYKAALRHEQAGEFPEPHAAMAKYYGTKVAGDMARYAVQAHGGRGVMKKLEGENETFKVERLFRSFKIGEIAEGANEVQKMIIAKNILGE